MGKLSICSMTASIKALYVVANKSNFYFLRDHQLVSLLQKSF